MTWTLANASKSAAANAVTALANAGTIQLYSGMRPATPDTAITTQTLLATLTCSATAFAAASNGVATANAVASGAAATGAATWARLFKSDGTTVIGDCDVGTTGGGQDLLLPSATFASGQLIACSSLTLTQP